MSSVREIAKAAGVSTATVSRALNSSTTVSPDTRRRVFDAVRKANYKPTVGRKNTQVIGLAYPQRPVSPEFGGFDAAIIDGVTRGADEHKFDVALLNIGRDKKPEESFTQFFMRKGVAGVVLRTFADSRGVAVQIADEGFPSVVVADGFDEPHVSFVRADSYAQSYAAVEHLIHLGHERIALAIHMVADSDHADRRRAYETALRDAGIEPDPALTAEIIADVNGGASGLTRLMSLPQPPTAIFFTDALAALGALCRAVALGVRVPADLSIVGFDDSRVRRMAAPNFTAVCQNAVEMGAKAAEWLTRCLVEERSIEPLRLDIGAYFEVNQTTAAPPLQPVRILPDGRRVES